MTSQENATGETENVTTEETGVRGPAAWGPKLRERSYPARAAGGTGTRPEPLPCYLSQYALSNFSTDLPDVFVDADKVSAFAVGFYTHVVGDELAVLPARDDLIAGARNGTMEFCEPETLDWLWCLSRERFTDPTDRAELAGRLFGVGPQAKADARLPVVLGQVMQLLSQHLANIACNCVDEEGLAALDAASSLFAREATATVTAWDVQRVRQGGLELGQAMELLQLPELEERFGTRCGSGPLAVADAVGQAVGRPATDIARGRDRAEAGYELCSELASVAAGATLDVAKAGRAAIRLRIASGQTVTPLLPAGQPALRRGGA